MSRRRKAAPMIQVTSRTIEEIRAIVSDNEDNGREKFTGLQSSEIGEYNRRIMFGDHDEAFPSQEEWSRIVD